MVIVVCSPTIRRVSITFGRTFSWSTSLPPRTLFWALGGGLPLPPLHVSPLLFPSLRFWRLYLLWWSFLLFIDPWRGRWWRWIAVYLLKSKQPFVCWPLTSTVLLRLQLPGVLSKPTCLSSSSWSLFSSSFFGSSSEADSSPEYDLRASIPKLLQHRLHVITHNPQVGGPRLCMPLYICVNVNHTVHTDFSIKPSDNY